MTKPIEKNIQLRALEELKLHYAKENNIVYAEPERKTKKEFGGKRADGLISFEKDGKYYTASLEAKSHKTLGALISFYDDEKFMLHSIIISAILTAMSILALISYTDWKWYYLLIIGLTAFISLTFLVALIFHFLDLNNHRVISVINQLKQYPANEQWIAYSKHTDNLLLSSPLNGNKDNLETLKKFCIKNKFGLLIVSNNKVGIEIFPKPKQGEFLKYYSKENEIKKFLKESVPL